MERNTKECGIPETMQSSVSAKSNKAKRPQKWEWGQFSRLHKTEAAGCLDQCCLRNEVDRPRAQGKDAEAQNRKMEETGSSLAGQWLKLSTFSVGGTLIPGWGTKIPYTAWCSQKKKRSNNSSLRSNLLICFNFGLQNSFFINDYYYYLWGNFQIKFHSSICNSNFF